MQIRRSPLLGEHSTEILEELLEYQSDEVEQLSETGAV